jgi:DUF4097 and DUF4098 domain-containing protein YvlB
MRKLTLVIAAFGLLAAAPSLFAADSGNWTKTWNVSGSAADLRVDADYGSLHIVQGSANTIRANVITTYWSIPSDVQVSDTQDGNHVEIRVRTPENHGGGWFHWNFQWHTPKVEIDLEVPSGSRLDLHTGFGDIRGENLNVQARVDTGFGGIHFPEFTGDLNGETGFGDITADGRFHELELKTGFGSVRAEADSGSQIHNDWRLDSGFGDVSLRVPTDLDANIDASSGFGHVSSELPLNVTEESGHSELRGQLGKGGSPVELNTGFGSVHLGRS